MNKLKEIWTYIRSHKYKITLITFILIIGVFDENSLIVRWSHKQEISELKKEIAHFKRNYENDSRMLKEITNNNESLEKVAREKYLMKKADEDIFVFEEDLDDFR